MHLSGSAHFFHRHGWKIAVLSIVILLLCGVSSVDLPQRKQYESRYEVRLRGFGADLYDPSRVLDSLGVAWVDAQTMCDSLSLQVPPSEADVRIWCDKTQKITIRVRHDQADSAQLAAQQIYATLDPLQYELLNVHEAGSPHVVLAWWQFLLVVFLVLALIVCFLPWAECLWLKNSVRNDA